MGWDRGIHLPGPGLWLDPHTVRELAFVSHAHADHTRRHRLALMTPQTHDLLPEARRPRQVQLVDLGQSVELGTSRLEFHDAGHILGSAMLLVRQEGESMLYSGDMKLRRALGGGSTLVPAVRVLILESTYGRPQYRFPEPASVVGAIAAWCRAVTAAGITPVLLANALGKAQELMLALAPHGLTFALEKRCVPWTEGYERSGIVFPDWVPLDPARGTGERVVLCPPAGKTEIRRLARARVALVSGWAEDRRMRTRFGADAWFACSDHCDFDELIEVAAASGAEQVYTVHGFAEDLARHLRRRGIRASQLQSSEQLELI